MYPELGCTPQVGCAFQATFVRGFVPEVTVPLVTLTETVNGPKCPEASDIVPPQERFPRVPVKSFPDEMETFPLTYRVLESPRIADEYMESDAQVYALSTVTVTFPRTPMMTASPDCGTPVLASSSSQMFGFDQFPEAFA
jgi:hypothetical protein